MIYIFIRPFPRLALLDISDYYEGDMLCIRIEMNTTPAAGTDILIWSVEMSSVKWADGDAVV